ncbi:MAG: DUF2812 domain-containing protein [Bacillota bacterium]
METNNILKVRKIFWAWQDELEETWLESMAMKGFHFVDTTKFGTYTFMKGEPKKVRYCLDYQASQAEKEKYMHIFTDAGWEYIGQLNNWQYYRKEYEGDEAPEIFSDIESKIQKYNRVLALFSTLLIPIGILPIILANAVMSEGSHIYEFTRGFLTGIGIAFSAVSIFMITGVSGRIREVKNR